MAKSEEELDSSQPKSGGAGAKKAKPASKVKPMAKPNPTEASPEKPVKAGKADGPKADEKPAMEPVVVSKTAGEDGDKPVMGGNGNRIKAVGDRAAAALGGLGSMGSRRDLKSLAIKLASVAIALIAVVVIVFGVLIYVYKSQSPAVAAVAAVVPYPVERVNGRFVSYHDYLFEVDANQRAYQNNAKLNNQPAVDFKSADGKKLMTQIKQHSLDKLKSDALVDQLAAGKHVKVTDKEVNDLVNQLYQRYGGKDTLLKTLKEIYGWDLGDLRKVVRKQLLAKDLEEKVTSDPKVDATAKAKAQDVLKQVQAGGDFTDLAKKYSQASDAANGGDLGFFTKGQLPDNLQSAAEALQPDQVSDVVKTQYGYEIIKVIEKKDDGSIHAQHILIKTIDFNEYFQNELKKAKTNTYIKA